MVAKLSSFGTWQAALNLHGVFQGGRGANNRGTYPCLELQRRVELARLVAGMLHPQLEVKRAAREKANLNIRAEVVRVA